ncbi:MAG: ATP synthase F0 subunit B [Candidatus Pacebacteria bacterium]|nr:ATP synthase F0 subunit B [Candidatus Paceibacterota bacterium]MBP9840479.1 ATP synthase F0 subunit B [Candidatus Paceibacterota bacterium]
MSALFGAFGVEWHLLLIQAVNFAILVAGLTYFLYRPVMNIVAERQRVVAKGVEDAEAAATALREADNVAKARKDAAETESQELVERARQSALEQKARIAKEAEERAAKIAEDAELRAKETAAKSLRDSEQEIARLAILAAGKAVVEK